MVSHETNGMIRCGCVHVWVPDAGIVLPVGTGVCIQRHVPIMDCDLENDLRMYLDRFVRALLVDGGSGWFTCVSTLLDGWLDGWTDAYLQKMFRMHNNKKVQFNNNNNDTKSSNPLPIAKTCIHIHIHNNQ